MDLANYNQFEREMISDRTRDALQRTKAQGIRLGPAPSGYELSHQVDDKAADADGPRAGSLAPDRKPAR